MADPEKFNCGEGGKGKNLEPYLVGKRLEKERRNLVF